MAVCEVLTERYPLLMENSSGLNGQEHVINITKDNIASSSISHHDDDHHSGTDTMHYEDRPSTSTPHPISQTPTESDSRNVSFRRDEDNNDTRQPRRSPLNSGLWITIELLVNLSQIVAAIIVLSLSRHEKPHTPLFGWVVGYTMGCIATLPHLYWRYIHGNGEHANSHQNSLQNQENASRSSSVVSRLGPRFNAFADNFKMALDCFFAVWFVIGNVWIFSGHSSLEDSPNLYRLCIAFLTFNCIGYAMPFILCATICCCLPCIISILGYREDLGNTRGATTEAINALPTYKFRSKRKQNREQSENSSEGPLEGGIFAAGTSKERIVSAEDAVCCICLAQYLDNEELRELPCAHFFHTDCVDKWLAIKALCPLCKSAVGKSSGPSTFFTTSSRHTGNGSNDRV